MLFPIWCPSPLDRKIKPVNHKGNQPWIFVEKTVAEAEVLILRPLDVKSWLTGKYPDAGKDWGQEEKGATEDETVGWPGDSMDMSLSKLKKTVDRETWRAAVLGVTKSQTWLSNWRATTIFLDLNNSLLSDTFIIFYSSYWHTEYSLLSTVYCSC